MSHMVKVKMSLKNKEMLKNALTRLGYKFKEGNFTISEYGKSEKAQIQLDKSLGLSQQKDGTWAFVGDPYHCKTQKLSKFYGKMNQLTNQVSTAYAIEDAKETLENQQFFCIENKEGTVGEDGMITMVYERLG